jgi:hypothetical protein
VGVGPARHGGSGCGSIARARVARRERCRLPKGAAPPARIGRDAGCGCTVVQWRDAGRGHVIARIPTLDGTAARVVGGPEADAEALASAAAELRRCSDLAGGPLVVQFTTAEGGDKFADVAIHSRTSPAVDRCVSDATADLRFQPVAEPQRFTEEYP